MILDLSTARSAIANGSGKGITVAILDTGIFTGHPDFTACHFLPPLEATQEGTGLSIQTTTPSDPVGHGTAIAGIIHQLAPEASLLSIRVLNAQCRQSRHEAIKLAAFTAMQAGAQILNCSFGIPGSNFTLPIYKDWIDHAFLNHHHLVTASSNTHPEILEWPSHFATTHSVTCGELACDQWKHLPGYPIAFEAKGIDVRVPTPAGGHTTLTGSSFAAAHFSGLLARLHSQFPNLSPSLAREILRRLASA